MNAKTAGFAALAVALLVLALMPGNSLALFAAVMSGVCGAMAWLARR